MAAAHQGLEIEQVASVVSLIALEQVVHHAETQYLPRVVSEACDCNALISECLPILRLQDAAPAEALDTWLLLQFVVIEKAFHEEIFHFIEIELFLILDHSQW